MSKPAKQAWLDYLIFTIGNEHDPAIKEQHEFFDRANQEVRTGTKTFADVRDALNVRIHYAVALATNKHRARSILEAAFKYMENPDLKVEVTSK